MLIICVSKIMKAQNVGIGTTAPVYPLHLQTPGNVNSWGLMHTNGNVYLGSFIYSNGVAEFGTRSNHPLWFFTNNSDAPPALSISSTGQFVGINTTSPQTHLDIYGSNTQLRLTDNSTANSTTISRYTNRLEIQTPDIFQVAMGTTANPSFIIKSNGYIGIGDNSPVNKVQIGTILGFSGNDLAIGDNGKGMSFYQSSTASIWYSNTNFSLMPNGSGGNVGIGTLNPAYPLSVNGTIQSKEVRVETGWADFVFDEHYELPSLDSVEIFTKQNKHLPGIPSAEEIKKNGLAVGELQTKMMQKIEELTLYTIELKKEINELKASKK